MIDILSDDTLQLIKSFFVAAGGPMRITHKTLAAKTSMTRAQIQETSPVKKRRIPFLNQF
jgi:hypothetical protein